MTALIRRSDGRVLIRVPLPSDVVEAADRMAKATSKDRATLLGDLVVQQLPAVLLEAVRDLFPNAQMPPALTDGIQNLSTANRQAGGSIVSVAAQPDEAVSSDGPT